MKKNPFMANICCFSPSGFKSMKRLVTGKALAMTMSLQVPIKFTLMATIMVYKKSIELEQGTKDLIREEKLNDCSAQRTLD